MLTQKKMEFLDTPKNDWAKALYYIIADLEGGTNMLTVLKRSPFFWKFQTRVSNISKLHSDFNMQLIRTATPFKDKATGKDGYYTHYTFKGEKSYLIDLYNEINNKGLSHSLKTEKK